MKADANGAIDAHNFFDVEFLEEAGELGKSTAWSSLARKGSRRSLGSGFRFPWSLLLEVLWLLALGCVGLALRVLVWGAR